MTTTEHTTAIVELLGHRRLVGELAEIEFAGAAFLQLEVALPGDRTARQLFTAAAIFAITPVNSTYVTDSVRTANEYTLASHDLLGTEHKAAYIARLEDEAAKRREYYALSAQEEESVPDEQYVNWRKDNLA